MKWPHIDEYISDFKKAHVHGRQLLKGIDRVQQFIEGLAGSVKRAMMDKFQTYEKAKKQASHIMGIQKLLHWVYKKRNDVWTDAQGQPQKTLRPMTPKKPTSHVQSHKEQKKLKKAWQACQKAAKREKGMGAHLFTGTPSMSSNSPIQKSTMGEIQMDRPSFSITDNTTPSINDLCTQLKKPYAQWKRRSGQLLAHHTRGTIQPASPICLEKKEWCGRHLSLHTEVNAVTCLHSPHT